MFLYGYVHITAYAGNWRDQKLSDALESKLKVVMTHLTRVLKTKLRSSPKAVNAEPSLQSFSYLLTNKYLQGKRRFTTSQFPCYNNTDFPWKSAQSRSSSERIAIYHLFPPDQDSVIWKKVRNSLVKDQSPAVPLVEDSRDLIKTCRYYIFVFPQRP